MKSFSKNIGKIALTGVLTLSAPLAAGQYVKGNDTNFICHNLSAGNTSYNLKEVMQDLTPVFKLGAKICHDNPELRDKEGLCNYVMSFGKETKVKEREEPPTPQHLFEDTKTIYDLYSEGVIQVGKEGKFYLKEWQIILRKPNDYNARKFICEIVEDSYNGLNGKILKESSHPVSLISKKIENYSLDNKSCDVYTLKGSKNGVSEVFISCVGRDKKNEKSSGFLIIYNPNLYSNKK